MDFENLLKQAKTEVSMHHNSSYMDKFYSDEVKAARNRWHAAAVEADESWRLAGEDSQRHLRAIEEEAKAHEEYCAAKDAAGILERVHGGRDND